MIESIVNRDRSTRRRRKPDFASVARFDQSGVSWLDLAMKRVKIAELKDRLSEHLRAVERGGTVLVTDRDRPIARIVPVSFGGQRATVTSPRVPFTSVRSKKRKEVAWPLSSLEILAEERRER
jgi:prevent-host-death family protein